MIVRVSGELWRCAGRISFSLAKARRAPAWVGYFLVIAPRCVRAKLFLMALSDEQHRALQGALIVNQLAQFRSYLLEERPEALGHGKQFGSVQTMKTH